MNNRGTRERASYSERKQQQQQGTKRCLSREQDIGSGYDHRSSCRSSHLARSATTTTGGGGGYHSAVVGGSASSTPRDDQDGGGRDSSLSSSHQNGYSKHRGSGGYNNHHRPKSGSVGSTSSSRSVLASSRERRKAEYTCCCCCPCCSCCCSRSSVKGSEGSFKQHRNHQDCIYNNDGGVYLGEDAEVERQERLQNECESGHCAEESGNDCGNSGGGARHHHHNNHHHGSSSRRRRHSNNSAGGGGNNGCTKTGGNNCNSSGRSKRRSSEAAKCSPQEGVQVKQRGGDDHSKMRYCEATKKDNREEKDESSPAEDNTLLVSDELQRPLASARHSSDGNGSEVVSLLAAPALTSEQSAMTTASSGDIWQLRPCVLPTKETSSASSLLVGKTEPDVGKRSVFVVGDSTSSCPSVSSLSCSASTANCSSNVDSSNLICSSYGSGIPNCPNVGSSNLNCVNVGSSNPNCSSIGFNKINCSSVCSSNPNCSNVSSKKPNCSNVCSSDPNCSFAGTGATNCLSSAGTSASGGDHTICSSAHDSKASGFDGLPILQTWNPAKLETDTLCPILNASEGKGRVDEHTKGCCGAGALSCACNGNSKFRSVSDSAPTTSQQGKSLACKCAVGCCRSGTKEASPRFCPVDTSSGGDGDRENRIIVNFTSSGGDGDRENRIIVNGCVGDAVMEGTDNNRLEEYHVNSFNHNNVASTSSISSNKEREAAGTSGLSVSSDILDDRFCSSSSPQLLSTIPVSGTSTSHLPTPANSSSSSSSMPSRVDSSPSDENSLTSLCDCGNPSRTTLASPVNANAKNDNLVSSSSARDKVDCLSCVTSTSSKGNVGRPLSCSSPSCQGHHSCQEVSRGSGLSSREWPCKATSLPCGGSKCHHVGKNLRTLSNCPGESSVTGDGVSTRAERGASDSSTKFVQHCHGKSGTCCSHQTNLKSCSKHGSCSPCVGGAATEVYRRCCNGECPKPCCGGKVVLANMGLNQQRHFSCRGGTQNNPDHPNVGGEKMVDVGSHRVSLRASGVSTAPIRPNRNSSTMVLDYTHALLKDDVPRPRSSFKLDDYHRALLYSLTDDEYQEVFLKHMVLRAGNSAGGAETDNASQILDSISQSRLLLQADAAADQGVEYRSPGFKVSDGEENLLKWNQNAQVKMSAVHNPQVTSLNRKSKVKKTGSGGENKERRQLFKSKWWKNLKKKKKEPVISETSSEKKRVMEESPKRKLPRSGEMADETMNCDQEGGLGQAGEPEEEDETTRMLSDEEMAIAKATLIWQKQDRLKLTQETALKDNLLEETSKKHAHEKQGHDIDKFLPKQLMNSGRQSNGDDGPPIAKALQADTQVLSARVKTSQANAKILPSPAKGSLANGKAHPVDAQTQQTELQNNCSDTDVSPEEDKRVSQTRSQTSLQTEQACEQTAGNGELFEAAFFPKKIELLEPAELEKSQKRGLLEEAPQENVNLRTVKEEVAPRDFLLDVCDLYHTAASDEGPPSMSRADDTDSKGPLVMSRADHTDSKGPLVMSCDDTGSQASAGAPLVMTYDDSGCQAPAASSNETVQGSCFQLEDSPLKTE